MRVLVLCGPLLFAAAAFAQTQKSGDVAPFVTVDAPVFVLNHVRVIDGTGAAAKEDQAIVIANGKIQSIGPAASAQIPSGAQVLDRAGYTVIPGLVGMHDHLYYTDSIAVQVAGGKVGEPGLFVAEIPYTAPRLYLAAGVTTMRTTGSLEPYTDLKVKSRIDANLMPGPSIDATAPYLEGGPTRFAQMHELTGPDDAKRMVDYWAAEGMTSFKAYMNITREELGTAIKQAHGLKLKLTGHLCSVTWPEAVALGIDDLEHGPVFADTEFAPNKKPDACPPGGQQQLGETRCEWRGGAGADPQSCLPPRGRDFHPPRFRSQRTRSPEIATSHSRGHVHGIGPELPDRAGRRSFGLPDDRADAQGDGF